MRSKHQMLENRNFKAARVILLGMIVTLLQAYFHFILIVSMCQGAQKKCFHTEKVENSLCMHANVLLKYCVT